MDLMALSATLTLDSKDYEQGIKKAQTSGNQLAASLEKSFGRIKTALKAAFTVAAVKKSVDGIMNLANTTAQAADRIDKQSQALGISRKAFQQWDYILAQSGASIDSLGVSMKTLNTAILGGSDSAVEAFDQLGLKLSDLQGLSQEDAFGKVVDAFQRMPQSARKSALAVQLLGKQGQSLMPLLNTSAEGMAQLRANTERLGFVMSDSMIDAGVKFGDTLDDLKRTGDGLKNTLGYALMEPLTGIFEAVTNFFAQEDTQTAVKQFAVDLNSLGNLVLDGVQTFFQWISDNGETIGGYLGNIGSFLHDIWDVVGGFAVETVKELVGAFQDFMANASPEQIAAIGGLATAIGLIIDPVKTIGILVALLVLNWDTVKKKAEEALKAANDFFTQELPTTVHDKLQEIADELAPMEESFEGTRQKIKEFFLEKVPDTFRKAVQAIADAFTSVSTWVRTATTRVKNWLDSLDNPVARNFARAIGAIAGAFGAVAEKIREAIAAFQDWQAVQAAKNKAGIDSRDASLDYGGGDVGRTVQQYANDMAAMGMASGVDYIPSNGMHAILHEGEAVLNKRDATAWRSGGQPQISAAALASAVSSALEGMAVVMDKEQVGRLTAQTVSRELERKARAGRFAFA